LCMNTGSDVLTVSALLHGAPSVSEDFRHEARIGTAASNKNVGACVLTFLHALLTTLLNIIKFRSSMTDVAGEE
ncbi:hypothetical protein PIB30_065489, partial [Stylosanthes scabra]|nr:hypothetical protein [Stylosanthes scabra]